MRNVRVLYYAINEIGVAKRIILVLPLLTEIPFIQRCFDFGKKDMIGSCTKGYLSTCINTMIMRDGQMRNTKNEKMK
ncbi:hypothetical protein MM221_15230 [Salipaludibacillus sp. LMS25]|uniref:hypothetical protein n=1 Tax=Salipaludibacillus sp. LMS25 TaxID=2924031 RepID=UPI0020D0B544|nr:hypothetical protein [Salipaludibacillus sp. LMS25]UTR13950.1 hypothetical protein MM221_15230 [Salipaludibacillus sp. LMS25]